MRSFLSQVLNLKGPVPTGAIPNACTPTRSNTDFEMIGTRTSVGITVALAAGILTKTVLSSTFSTESTKPLSEERSGLGLSLSNSL